MTDLPTTVVLWDIDGTLLSTGRAGLKAWVDAVREVLGAEVDLASVRMSGLTDPMIAREILAFTGHPADHDLERQLIAVYSRELPGCLTLARGGVLPGVTDILKHLSARADILVTLLTGNMRSCAYAKLVCYGLDQYFETGGFGDDGFDRVEIGRAALRRVAETVGELDPARVYLVGDSPYDIACASALGIRMIAVATGEHLPVDLDVDGAWWVLERLPGPDEFVARLGLAATNVPSGIQGKRTIDGVLDRIGGEISQTELGA